MERKRGWIGRLRGKKKARNLCNCIKCVGMTVCVIARQLGVRCRCDDGLRVQMLFVSRSGQLAHKVDYAIMVAIVILNSMDTQNHYVILHFLKYVVLEAKAFVYHFDLYT